jgi:hypothetical protein
VSSLKSLKTYNLDQDVINILSRQANKSQYVCRAVRRLSHNIDEISPADFPTRQLLAALHARTEISPHLAGAILVELSTQV